MKARIEAIRNKVLAGEKLANGNTLWSGAGLVITDKPVSGMRGKVVVVTKHAQELSSLVFELRMACADWLDYMNKYEFYPRLGEAAISYLKEADDLQGLLLLVIDEAELMDDEFNRILYFAYGSNMDEDQMAERCPGARLVEKTTVKGYRFALDERGVATIIPDMDAAVEGLVWAITPENQSTLDRYEGVAYNCYRREEIFVRTGKVEGKALVYISNHGPCAKHERSGYMAKIIQAACDHAFSDSYIRELCGHADVIRGKV